MRSSSALSEETRLKHPETHLDTPGGLSLRRPLSAILAGAALLVTAGCASNDVTDPTPTTRVTKAGWSFGFCLGACRGDLTLDGDRLDYRMTDREGVETLLANAGSLTASGRTRLSELAAALGTTPLQEVYGCPDCADGGAAWVEFQRDGAPATSRYEYRRPPPVLEGLDDFLAGVMEALQSCTATGSVELAAGCAPLVR